MWRRQCHDRRNVVLMLGKLNEVQVLALLDIIVVDDDGRGASVHLLAELCVVLLLDLNEGIGLMCSLSN